MKNQNRGFKKKFVPNTEATLVMDASGICNDRQYDVDSLTELLKTIPFEKMSYPIIASKQALFGDKAKGGTTQVGYIRSATYGENVSFDVTLYAKVDNAIKATFENPILYPKVIVDDNGNIEKIISFSIVEGIVVEDDSE